jgi:hypothetical protein
MCANSECALRHMRLCRFLINNNFLLHRLRFIVTPKVKLNIFNQESLLGVLSILCTGRSTTLLFKTPP